MNAERQILAESNDTNEKIVNTFHLAYLLLVYLQIYTDDTI
jgi:hypothetical protein